MKKRHRSGPRKRPKLEKHWKLPVRVFISRSIRKLSRVKSLKG